MATMEQIKKIREKTGVGVMDVKRALDEANGDEAKAVEILRKKGHDKAMKKSDREAKEGVIVSYIHSNNKVAAMLKLHCETDFVARNEEFKALAYDIAMHIVAASPKVVKPEDIEDSIIEKEKEIWIEQLKQEGKDEKLIENILKGKEKKFREETALMTQSFVKNPDITIADLLAEKIGKIGENIQVGEFVRFEL